MSTIWCRYQALCHSQLWIAALHHTYKYSIYTVYSSQPWLDTQPKCGGERQSWDSVGFQVSYWKANDGKPTTHHGGCLADKEQRRACCGIPMWYSNTGKNDHKRLEKEQWLNKQLGQMWKVRPRVIPVVLSAIEAESSKVSNQRSLPTRAQLIMFVRVVYPTFEIYCESFCQQFLMCHFPQTHRSHKQSTTKSDPDGNDVTIFWIWKITIT